MFTPKFLANESIEVHIADGYDENGELKIIKLAVLKARIESAHDIVHLTDGSKATLKQKAFVFDNIDELPKKFDGKVIVDGEEYKLILTQLFLNPDGSRNHFVLGMM